MEQDVNKILQNLSQEWARQSMQDKQRLAVMGEEIERLKAKIEELEKE